VAGADESFAVPAGGASGASALSGAGASVLALDPPNNWAIHFFIVCAVA
jgi:hypothetical protein